jgi:hypothetical protein
LDTHEPGTWITDFIVQKILDTRAELRVLASEDNISDFNSTLVACLLSPTGGFSIHIGDGAIFGESNDGRLEVISSPENGEYANETFFVTEPHWIRHLRVTPMKPMRWLTLCTDGGTALTMENEEVVKTGFVYPLLRAIASTDNREQKSKILEGFLSDPKADTLTTDDKTVVVMMASSLKSADIIEHVETHAASRTDHRTKSAEQPIRISTSLSNKKSERDEIETPLFFGKLISAALPNKSLLFDSPRYRPSALNSIIIILIFGIILLVVIAILTWSAPDPLSSAPSGLGQESKTTLEGVSKKTGVPAEAQPQRSEERNETTHEAAKQEDGPSIKSPMPVELKKEQHSDANKTPADKNGGPSAPQLPSSEQLEVETDAKKAAPPPSDGKTITPVDKSSFVRPHAGPVITTTAEPKTGNARKRQVDKGSKAQ